MRSVQAEHNLAMQVATTATFSACALEALRMLLADLEQPGGTLTSPIKAPMSLLFPIALALFPIVLPAGFVGKKRSVACVKGLKRSSTILTGTLQQTSWFNRISRCLMQLCIASVNKQWCEKAAAASLLDQCLSVCSDVANTTAATLLTLNLRCHVRQPRPCCSVCGRCT